MELVHVAVVVLSLLSAGQSSPVTSCESLTQPLDFQGRDQLLGRWTYLGESTDMLGTRALTKMFMETSWLNFTAGDNSDTINTFQSQKMLGLCFSVSYKHTLKNNTLSMVQPYSGSGILLNTGCPDCLVLYSNYTIGQSSYKVLQLLSKRAKVSAAELEEFKKQAECLSLSSPVFLDSEKGFCSDESVSQQKTIDLSDTMNNITSDQLSQLDKILRSQGGVKTLMEMLTSAVGQINPN
ncbi:uncharacterized protein LOC103353161 [Stegastes partitus]|uniref:Uncharacterized protein LOC103353161 n=1 Tax=Stegastes partitus TaxID=144197 RepID=A0A9Y4JFC0_9TELE|nr:PREDICTED: uncharacterized protein LOC103353161 [Stegastes partitus]